MKVSLHSAMIAGWCFAIVSLPISAIAGPPFRTDDPEPVDYKHWEFYTFTTGTHVSGDTSGVGPAFEFNYGLIPNGQFHIGVPAAFDGPAGGHRTKTEHPATILLPNPVAADDTERHATDRPVKIRRQINTRWGSRPRAVMAITEFRVRCLFSTRLSVSHVRVRLTSRKSTNRLRRANSNVSRVASVHSVR
jgi:hypothetical protein